MAARQSFLAGEGTALSAADMLLALLGLPWSPAAGPAQSGRTSIAGDELSRAAFERAKTDAADFIRAHGRLPAEVWVGSQTLALADFAATLAGDDGHTAQVKIRKGNPEMEHYIDTDSASSFRWVIHPDAFRAPHLLELARLQCWALKPAVLK